MREYYIRREGDEDSSGPFDIDQISSLIEAGKLDASAFYYDIETENWLLISSNQEMMDTLFPKKRKLTLRTPEIEAEEKRVRLLEEEAAEEAEANAEQEDAKAEDPETGEPQPPAEVGESKPKFDRDKKKRKPAEEEKPEKLEVTKMLALAEGRSQDSSGKTPREKQAAAAFYGLRFLTLFFICSILAMGYIELDLVTTADAIQMAQSPYLLLGAFDVIMIVFLLLQVTEVYPLLRFRAAIGAGLLTVLFYASGDGILVVSNLLLMGAIYFCSAAVRLRMLTVCATAGILGILGYLYVFFAG